MLYLVTESFECVYEALRVQMLCLIILNRRRAASECHASESAPLYRSHRYTRHNQKKNGSKKVKELVKYFLFLKPGRHIFQNRRVTFAK